jgi:hypothetical protein
VGPSSLSSGSGGPGKLGLHKLNGAGERKEAMAAVGFISLRGRSQRVREIRVNGVPVKLGRVVVWTTLTSRYHRSATNGSRSKACSETGNHDRLVSTRIDECVHGADGVGPPVGARVRWLGCGVALISWAGEGLGLAQSFSIFFYFPFFSFQILDFEF